MEVSFATDDFDRLICSLHDGDTNAVVTATGRAEAAANLLAALDDTANTGRGECFWPEAGGEYRWAFRREGSNVRFAVMWSAGTLTGWEHVFWSESPFASFHDAVRAHIPAVDTHV